MMRVSRLGADVPDAVVIREHDAADEPRVRERRRYMRATHIEPPLEQLKYVTR
jgi:hypothetical protein